MTEIIFSTVAGMGLWFRFVLETWLTSQGCFCYWWPVLAPSWGLFCLSPHPSREWGWGCTNSWEEIQPGQLTLTGQRNILYHIALYSAHKSGGENKEEGECSEWWHLTSQVTVNTWWSPAILDMAEHMLAHGKWWINSLYYFAGGFFPFLTVFISTHMFSHFYSFNPLPYPTVGSE